MHAIRLFTPKKVILRSPFIFLVFPWRKESHHSAGRTDWSFFHPKFSCYISSIWFFYLITADQTWKKNQNRKARPGGGNMSPSIDRRPHWLHTPSARSRRTFAHGGEKKLTRWKSETGRDGMASLRDSATCQTPHANEHCNVMCAPAAERHILGWLACTQGLN
jgi:hypothetical protein